MAPPPVIRLHPDDGVVIARATLLPGTPVGRRRRRDRAHSRRPQGRDPRPSPWASRSAATARSSASPPRRSRRAQHVHVQNCGMGDFAKDYAYGVDATPDRLFRPARDLPGHPPSRRPGRDPQLHRHPHQRELLAPMSPALVADVFRRNPFTGDNPLADFPNVDGVVALTHKTGCGMTQDEPLRAAAPHARRLRPAREFLRTSSCWASAAR